MEKYQVRKLKDNGLRVFSNVKSWRKTAEKPFLSLTFSFSWCAFLALYLITEWNA
jgi:hypothetical protein